MPSSTALIASRPALEDLLAELQGESAIGIDTEFLRERTYRAELCLVQMTTRREPVCIDPPALGDPDTLRPNFNHGWPLMVLPSVCQDREGVSPIVA